MGGGKPWVEAETVLALDLYQRHKPRELSKSHPDIVQLAGLLRRTPDSVYMKLCNFLSLDDAYSGSGLQHASELDRAVWKTYAGRPQDLSRAAQNARKELS
jgi:hypothetical protein